MAKLLEFNFDETAGSGTAADSVGISGEHGTFYGDGTTNGSGGAVFDGSGDYVKVPSNALFDLDQGTISMTFTLDTLPSGNSPSTNPGAATLFYVDAASDDDGHVTVFIKSDGTLVVSHQTPTSSSTMTVGSVTPV